MERTLFVDFDTAVGAVRPMHATNNGPRKGIGFAHQATDGFTLWREAGIPYARTHDSSFFSGYGGEHTVDVHAIFPNFDADECDPASYDFDVTDYYLLQLHNCGSRVFYRLGSKIEHEIKKYNTLPPRDYLKWARICEHIIMHYTEGWAGGFTYDMAYWEIWNEPDLDPDEAKDKRTWGGTARQFYEFYEVAATHLKARFPHLKIGGPACAFREGWLRGFLSHLTAGGKRVPLDFFSWHCYGSLVEKIYDRAAAVRQMLDEYGYTATESILNEWNYIKAWDRYAYSVKQIISIKGAAFTAACMCGCQSNTTVDMLMYYDARPSTLNGLFDYYTNAPLKGYYPFRMFNELYRLGTACRCRADGADIYAAARGDSGRAVMIAYYTDDDDCREPCDITLSFSEGGTYELRLLDSGHDNEQIGTVTAGEVVRLYPNTVCLLSADNT